MFRIFKKDSNEKKYNIDLVFGLFFILILLGKVVRYTIMKNVLVDSGIGHFFINPILYGNYKFTFFDADSMSGEAGGNAILIFRFINIFKLDTYYAWEIYISFIWNIILIGILVGVNKEINLKQLLFIILSIIVLNIFDFTLAKEPIQMLYFIAIYYVLTMSNKGEKFKYISTIVILMISAITFRVYYFLIIMFMIYTQLLLHIFILKKEKVRIKDILFILLLIVIFYYIFLNIVKVAMPSQFSELIRVRTRTSEAASDMRNIFKSSNLIVFSVDYLIMILRMLFPVELLRLGVKYIPYVFYQIVITLFIINAIKKVRNNDVIKNIVLYLFIGFLFASAAFEPDFGSWIRHEAVLFPVLLIVANIKKRSMKGKSKKDE